MNQHACFDGDLAQLEAVLRRGDLEGARLELATFDLKLGGYARGEERAVFPALESRSPPLHGAISMMRREHEGLRGAVAALWQALDAGDVDRGLQLLEDLRSVLVLHIVKEDWVFAAGTPEPEA